MQSLKTISKIEHYWIYDSKFRSCVKKRLTTFLQESYSDISCSKIGYDELYFGLLDINCDEANDSFSDYKERNVFYNFSWTNFNLCGQVKKLLNQKSWEKILTRTEAEKLRDQIEIDSSFPLGYFFEGLEGNLWTEYDNISFFKKESIFANLAGYDIFLARIANK